MEWSGQRCGLDNASRQGLRTDVRQSHERCSSHGSKCANCVYQSEHRHLLAGKVMLVDVHEQHLPMDHNPS